MKLRLALLLFCLSGYVSTQVLNRIYMNADIGFPKHRDVGLVVHVFKHFSVGGYLGSTRVKVGRAYVTSYGALFNKAEHVKNLYDSKYLLFGVTTRSFKKLNCSLMLGPSWTDAVEFTNIQYHENEYSHTEHPTYDKSYRQGVGCAFRADGILQLSRMFGFNAGIQYNLNPVRSEWNVQLGINLGMVLDGADEDWRRGPR